MCIHISPPVPSIVHKKPYIILSGKIVTLRLAAVWIPVRYVCAMPIPMQCFHRTCLPANTTQRCTCTEGARGISQNETIPYCCSVARIFLYNNIYIPVECVEWLAPMHLCSFCSLWKMLMTEMHRFFFFFFFFFYFFVILSR